MNRSDNNDMVAAGFRGSGPRVVGLFVVLLGLLAGGAGCDRIGLGRAQRAENGAAARPAAGEKVCFECSGTGQRACVAPGCKDGLVECPGPCLKLSSGKWQHMQVAGHPDTDLWQSFHQADGTSHAWNQGHVGEVIEMRAGMAANVGKCPRCRGRAKVKCSACGGTRQIVCPICEAKKVVPESWTAFNNPRLKNPPKMIQLKDGRTVFGKIESRVGPRVYVRTEAGKQEELLAADIVNTAPPQK